MRKFSALIILTFLLLGCVEQFEPSTLEFDDVLVIEAVLTDESKYQEVYLTRSYKFEDVGPPPEENAVVQVDDTGGGTYRFIESEPGKYISTVPFGVKKGVEYTLSIKTADRDTYSSTPEHLSGTSIMDDLYAQRIVDDFGNDGMGILLDNTNDDDNASYYRYEYEETFKIIAPKWLSFDFSIINTNEVLPTQQVFASNGPESVVLAPKEEEELTCYGTNHSKNIILETTEELDQNRLVGFMPRFVGSDNYMLSHRYSVLVKQFKISLPAYTYYKILRDISSNESQFSENQPGFFIGNISSETNPNEKVIGFFEVSSMSEKRIFFNYSDFYPEEPLPSYISPCIPSKPLTLLESIRLDLVHYNDPGQNFEDRELITIPRECGDCTALGSNTVPAFWVD